MKFYQCFLFFLPTHQLRDIGLLEMWELAQQFNKGQNFQVNHLRERHSRVRCPQKLFRLQIRPWSTNGVQNSILVMIQKVEMRPWSTKGVQNSVIHSLKQEQLLMQPHGIFKNVTQGYDGFPLLTFLPAWPSFALS